MANNTDHKETSALTEKNIMMRPKHFFYGRRLGKKISPQARAIFEEAWPSVTYDPETWTQAFVGSPTIKERILDIGFGGGEHLMHTLQTQKDVGILGVEPFQNGLMKVMTQIHQAPHLKKRVCLSSAPIQILWPTLADQTFHRIHVFFPDPWPKKKHHKRRLLNLPTLAHISRLLVPGGLFVFASDDPSYIGFVLENLALQEALVYRAGVHNDKPEDWPLWPQDWPLTRYAQKARRQGRRLGFGVWERSRSPALSPDP
ncbi:tRNA (guanosine(46)-N7)-methyltransferase TrmB [bacterium NHP-B]|nr:tRNA (guanosine(46)-N7)-methyltransferase TrmB [bacterium NHP-B]